MEIGLSEAIQALRAEIVESMRGSADEPVKFRIDSVELELQVTATRGAEVDGGVRFWVLSIGGKGSVASSDAHRVKLQMSAFTAEGGEVLTGDSLEKAPL